MSDLHHGARGEQHRQFKAALKRRLETRGLGSLASWRDNDDVIDNETLIAARKAAWALGALKTTYERITDDKVIPAGVVTMVRNPGKRKKEQRERADARISNMRHERNKRTKAEVATAGNRMAVVRLCLRAAANYARNPGGYHYLAGGKPNLIYLIASPHDYRSDCSQFVSAVQHDAKLPDIGPNGPLWVNTVIMAHYLKQTDHPEPADFGMYGSRWAPHHTERYLGSAGGVGREFVGHGSPPIDSFTPGRPDFYLRCPL